MQEDNEDNYRAYLAQLLSQTKSRGHSRYYNQYAGRCKEEAAQAYPLGAQAANRRDLGRIGFWAMLFAALEAILG